MSDHANFTGSVPEHYDRDLGPVIFDGYAADLARRVAAHNPQRVLEIAAGTGIATRHLRDLLPTSRAPDCDRPQPAHAGGGPNQVPARRADRLPAC